MAYNTLHRPDIAAALEQQMRNWELARAQRPAAPERHANQQVQDFIAIARHVGAGGEQVGRLLGERLGWPVFDRELLQLMGDNHVVRTRLYERLDEHDATWLESVLRSLFVSRYVRDDYFKRLAATVLMLARRGRAIFLGRGVDLILPRERGLRVLVTGSPRRRAAALASERGVAENTALADVERIDRERAEFRAHHFGPAANDVTRYDLVLNTDQLGPDRGADVVLAALATTGLRTP